MSRTVILRRLISSGISDPAELIAKSPLEEWQTRRGLNEMVRMGLVVRETRLVLTGAKSLKRGTNYKGLWSPNARTKLDPEKVREIRMDSRPDAEVAADYGIHPATVSKVRRGAIWSHA